MFWEFLLILCYVCLVDLEKWSSLYYCGIWFTSGLAWSFPKVLTFFSQYFGEIMKELMLQRRFWNWFHPYAVCDKEVTIDMDLPFTTRRHVLPFLRCKQQKLHSQVVKIWYSSNYFWFSLFLLDSITVKWYKMTHLAQNEGCKNSTVGYGMKFFIWHYFSQIHIWQFGIFLLNITLFS